MKHLKYFEIINEGDPEVGDYVFVYIGNDHGKMWQDYINNSIGKIIINNTASGFIVEYTLSDYIIDNFLRHKEEYDRKYIIVKDDGSKVIKMHFKKSEIKKWSNDKNDLEAIIAQKKYNL
jgi:hypothetical protein